MGFRLGNFLAGMAEGAIELEENVRKRNEKIIDTEFERYRQREEDNRKIREASQDEYDQLARVLMSLPGMDSAKTYAVLDYGPEIAQSFIEKAPVLAKEEGLAVGDYVELMDKDAINSSINVNTLIRANKLPGMPGAREFEVPATLYKSPVFGRDYTGYAKRLDGATETEEQPDVALPKGKIKFMDMIEGKEQKLPQLSAGQVVKQLTEMFYDEFSVGYKRDPNTQMLIVTDTDLTKAKAAERAARESYGIYYNSIGPDGKFDVETEQYPAIEDSFNQFFLQKGAEAELISGSGQSGQTPAPTQTPAQSSASVTIPNSNITITMTPQGGYSMSVPSIVQAIVQANPGTSAQQANNIAKQLLDELNAKAK